MRVLGSVSELLLSVLASDFLHVAAVKTDSDTEDAVALRGNLENLFVEFLLLSIVERLLFSRGKHNLGALTDDSLRSALQQDLVALKTLVTSNNGGHSFALRAEIKSGHGFDAVKQVLAVAVRVLLDILILSGFSIVGAKLLSKNLEGALSWLTHNLESLLFLVENNVRAVVSATNHGEVLERLGRSEPCIAEAVQDLAFRRVRLLLDSEFGDVISFSTHDAEFDRAHFVLGKGTGLVGADNAGAAKGLNGRKSAHNAVVGGHLARSKGQASRDDCGQALRNGSDGKSDGDLKVVDAALESGTVDGVEEFVEVHGPDEEANHEDNLGKKLTKVVDLLRKRGLLFILLGSHHFRVDTTDSSFHASVSDDTESST